MTLKPDTIAYPPRGLSHEEAARYVGLGPTKFDELIGEGLMPKPKRIGKRVVWDRVALDIAFTALPTEGEDDSLQALLERSGRVDGSPRQAG